MTDPLDKLAADLASTITPTQTDQKPVERRWGTISRIDVVGGNVTGLHDVVLAASGVTIPNVRSIGYQPFVVGEVVVVDFTGSDPLIMGGVGADDGWVALGLVNGWAAYEPAQVMWAAPRYRKISGVVYMNGLAAGGTAGVTMGVLPVRFRPQHRQLYVTSTDTGAGRVDVERDGTVIHQGGGTAYFSFDTVRFVAAQ